MATEDSLIYAQDDDIWSAVNTDVTLLPPPRPLNTEWDEYSMKVLYQPNWLTPEFPYIPYLICHPRWEGPILGRFSDAEFSFIKCDDGWFMNQDL